MSEFDIEKFPTSETAKRMMSVISEEFYKDSYVMKWLQQVMGLEWDAAKKIIEEELPKQLYPETATWGLCYHEVKWQLPVRENLSYDERRRLIYQRRDFKAPMTPYKMEAYIKKDLGIEAYIADCHDSGDSGYVPNHPNMFKITVETNGAVDARDVYKTIRRLKQSHTAIELVELRTQNTKMLCPLIGISTIWYSDIITI